MDPQGDKFEVNVNIFIAYQSKILNIKNTLFCSLHRKLESYQRKHAKSFATNQLQIASKHS